MGPQIGPRHLKFGALIYFAKFAAIRSRDRPGVDLCFRLFRNIFHLFLESHSLKEPPHRPLVELRQPGDDHCAHAIVANFILAHLLICNAHELGGAVLSNVSGDPGSAQAPADLAINEIGFVFHLPPPKKQSGAIAAPPPIYETTSATRRRMVLMNREQDARTPLYRVKRHARGTEAQRVRAIIERHRAFREFMVPVEYAQDQVRQRLPIQARASDPAEPRVATDRVELIETRIADRRTSLGVNPLHVLRQRQAVLYVSD